LDKNHFGHVFTVSIPSKVFENLVLPFYGDIWINEVPKSNSPVTTTCHKFGEVLFVLCILK